MAPGARRGKPGGTSRLNASGTRNGPDAASGDVGMAEAPGAGGPDRRKRSGRGAVNSRTGKTPYESSSAPPSSRAGRPVNGAALGDRHARAGPGNRPAVLKESINIKGAVEALRQLVQSRWNAEAGLLNLENMAADSAFANSQLKPPGDRNAPKNAAPALWKLASELCPNLQSISLAANDLTSLTRIAPAALVRFFPTLQNLSLQNNKIDQFPDLNPLSAVVGTITGTKPGLTDLKELLLSGNPIFEKGMKANPLDYQNEARRRFPSLRMLDQVPIDITIPIPAIAPTASTSTGRPGGVSIAGRAKRQLEDQAQGNSSTPKHTGPRTKARLPLTMQPGFADSDASRNAMGQFLIKYFSVYDNDRSQLVYAYVPQATFSMCVNTTVSERARRTQHLAPEQIAKQKQLSWATYLGSAYDSTSAAKSQENLSRNFLRTKQAQRRQETLHVGPEAICTLLSKLPKTTHPLSDASKFEVDAWQQPGTGAEFPDLLVVAVHGEFAELPSMGSRSFDRTFVLAPAVPGSPAANQGWPCVVLSDLLLLRNWTNPDVWKVEASTASAPQAPAIQSDGLPALSPEQQNIMAQLHSQTRLNAQFCLQCLSETGWNLQAAVQAFEAAKGSIPAEAFL